MADLIFLERAGPIASLTLNRPERHNSLVPALLAALVDALQELGRDPACRAVLLRANGRSFSTGGDLNGFLDQDDLATYAGELVGLLNGAILAMVDLPVPAVAAVHGMVTGGSLGLVLASDIVLLTPQASFTPYYGVVGFSPDGGWTAMLPQVIGQKRAAAVLLGNLTIDAGQAVAWGLANRVVPADRLEAEALSVARLVAGMKPGAVRSTRRLLWQDRQALAARLEAERQAFVDQILTAEARSGMADFLHRMKS